MYSVGDKIIVSDNLKSGCHYNGVYFNSLMRKYMGKAYTIKSKEINTYDDGNSFIYRLNLEKGVWMFSENMLKPYKKSCKFMKKR